LDGLPGVGPHSLDDGPELAPTLGETVLDGGGAGGNDGALDEPGALEVAQALGEHSGRDAGDGLGELVEAQGPAEGGIDDGELPTPLQEVRRLADLRGNG